MAGQTQGVGADTSEQAADLPGASENAEELERRTIAALASMAGVQGHPDTPAAELGHALRPGAIALVVFVDPARAPVVRMGLQNIGAQVLSDDDLRRIGAGATGAATSGLQGGGYPASQRPGGRSAPSLNRFWHAARLTDATWRDGGCPTTTPCTRSREST